MKILLSAYACEPAKGSEPGVGWRWAIELANLGHEVWVITRANNQPVIDAALAAEPRSNLQFVYYDLPGWMRSLKKKPGGVYFYYFFWQWGIYKVAKSLAQEVSFDWVHHITFGVFRQPSFMAFLGLPFILGPLGGGEHAPSALRTGFPLKGRILDFLRDISNQFVAIDPLAHAVYQRSAVILCKTQETLCCIPAKYHHKCCIALEIGIDLPNGEIASQTSIDDQPFRLLYVGRLIYWKGLHLGLKAFSQFHKEHPNSRLTVVGSGSDADWLHQLAEDLSVNQAIDWIPWMEQAQVMQSYGEHDVFLFPSLHDSSGNVVLESLARRLPLVCLDLGGPGVLVDESCGRVVATSGKDEGEVVRSLAVQLKHLADDPELLQQLREGAITRASEYQWAELVNRVYASLDERTTP